MRKDKIIPYPCDIKRGDKIRTADGNTREVEEVGGRFIVFTDGTIFGIKHPDIVGVVAEKKKKQEEQEPTVEE